ncbi:beta-ketoacyl reductase, partial [Streptomyces sp. NPDC079167]|uniref:beta-ketoacyl reductase n=1 Tax=Streptomyces sp. NPDC079167 TaxID=3154513 RepID=UPI003443BAA8
GAEVVVAACDVSDRDALAGLVEEVEAAGSPVRAVFHAAGVGQMTGLVGMTADEFAGVLRAKVTGADNLDAVFGDRPLDAFVLFSSISAVWGSGGQAAYAAANAHLDALAERRRARGLTATSISWGPWAEGGMAEGTTEDLHRHGLVALAPARAVAELRQALAEDETTLTVADVDWERFAPAFTTRRPSPLLGELVDARAALTQVQAAADVGPDDAAIRLRERLSSATEPEQHRIVLELVRGEAARVLGHESSDAVKPRRGFVELGFDSLMAVEVRNRLSSRTGLRLPTTLLFDFTSSAALTEHLCSELAQDMSAAAPVASAITELERMLSGLPDTGVDREDITERLQGLLATWGGPQARVTWSDTLTPTTVEVDPALDAATSDEIFDLIQREFGKS